jgi:hypothetical protein
MRGERGEPVAVARGALEFELFRACLHLGGDALLHGVRLAGEEARASEARSGTRRSGSPACRAGAALDLVEQAGPVRFS